MPSTPPRTPTTPPPGPTAPGATPYDWSDPSAYQPPERDTARSDRAGHADHAFWETLPFPGVPWTRVLLVGVICFGLWFLLDAPSLQRSAQTSPLGTRRTVSMDVTGPVAALSRSLGLDNVVGWTDEALGRSPGGGPTLAVPIHRDGTRPATSAFGVSIAPSKLPVIDIHPTPASPLRVLIVGDSIGLDLGQPLVNALGGFGDVTTYLDGRIDTGLSRPDYFNWPAELNIDLANQQPQLVVVMIGANDAQGLVTQDGSIPFGHPGWDQAYSARVAAFIAEANNAGAHVLWVGMPPMQNPQLDASLMHVNTLVRTQIAETRYGGATFLSSAPALGDHNHNYAAYITDASGTVINIRTPDGIHLTPDGGARLAAAVVADMESKLHIQLIPDVSSKARRG